MKKIVKTFLVVFMIVLLVIPKSLAVEIGTMLAGENNTNSDLVTDDSETNADLGTNEPSTNTDVELKKKKQMQMPEQLLQIQMQKKMILQMLM